MVNSNIYPSEQIDFKEVSIEAILLNNHQIEQAIEIANQIPNETQRWKTYLNAIALFAFQQWLNERASELRVISENSTICQPQYANIIEAVSQVEIDDFKICLITTGSLTDEEISIPRAVIDLPEFANHFYVWLEIEEEAEQAIIRGFLHRDRLIQYADSANLQPQTDWTYSLPITWFDRNSNNLLLYLRCLEPIAIPLPEIPSDRVSTLSQLQVKLTALLPRLRSRDRFLWEVLNWQQGTAVLTSPELLNWLYQLQNSAITTEEAENTNYLSDLLQLLTQQAVNVARWIQDEMDEITQGFSWLLLPVVTEASSFRSTRSTLESDSPTEEFEAIITQITNAGIVIPASARGAYQNLSIDNIQVRLYAVTWPYLSPENTPEWSLMLVLAPVHGSTLPEGICLRVSDQTGILVQRRLNPNTLDTYLYVLIAGGWDEKFLATISLASGTSLTLPPFAFVP